MRKMLIVGLAGLSMCAITACGGGEGGNGGNPDPGNGGGPGYTPGVFPPSAQFAARCQVPRTGNDPFGSPWPDQPGTALLEKHFLRSWTHEFYLWADEVPDRNPFHTGGSSGGVLQYFDLLKTTVLDDSGQPKDAFHFAYDTNEYWQLALAGAVQGYGISWAILRDNPPIDVRVEFVQDGTAAAAGGVHRGARLLAIDGLDVVNATAATINAINSALFDPAAGSVHTLLFRERDGSGTFQASLTAGTFAFDAVPAWNVFNHGGRKVGYLLFNDHTAMAEWELRSAVAGLAAQQVEELVLDLRYNGGGFLDIASELAYMIAGPAATEGRVFERRVFNSKHTGNVDPVTGEPLDTPFHSRTLGYSVEAGHPLPHLDLSRVLVLTSPRTCSASESIINGLRGIGIEVIQVGGTTCGKPYGFYPRDNCGTTYFSIQFGGVNALGFGEYTQGFSATRATGNPMANLPGCGAADDLSHELGDPQEGQLQAALHYLANGSCPPVMLAAESAAPQGGPWPADSAVLRKPPPRPWENNRILRR